MPVNVGSSRAVMCLTERVASGRGETVAREVHNATWSTGTMLTLLFMSGTSSSWMQLFTIRQMKSSVFVTGVKMK